MSGIVKQVFSTTSGTDTSFSQSFYSNYWVNYASSGSTGPLSNIAVAPFYNIPIPNYFLVGGTPDPYDQFDNTAIASSVNSSFFVRVVFTAGTQYLSGTSVLKLSISKLPYQIYSIYSDIQQSDSETLSSQLSSTVGAASTLAQQIARSKALPFGASTILPTRESAVGEPLTNNDLATIQNLISSSAYTITMSAATSGITTTTYDFQLPGTLKQPGSFTAPFFEDKSHYFVQVDLLYNFAAAKSYSDYTTIVNNKLVTIPWQDTVSIVVQDSPNPIVVKSGSFQGLSGSNRYFAYFSVPNKPIFHSPFFTGNTSTYSAELYWVNGDGANSYIIQVNYSGDTTFSSATSTYTYNLDKTQVNVAPLSNSDVVWPFTTTTNKNLFSTQIPIQPNSNIWYRVGNVKSFVDIFGMYRQIVAYSDAYSATTQPQDIALTTFSQSDSLTDPSTSIWQTIPSLSSYTPSISTGTSIVSGYCSIVGGPFTIVANDVGVTVTLVFPNSSTLNTTTDSFGNYMFTGLTPGSFYEVKAADYTNNAFYNGPAFALPTGTTIQNIPLSAVSWLSGVTKFDATPESEFNLILSGHNTGYYATTISGSPPLGKYIFNGLSADTYTLFYNYLTYSGVTTSNILHNTTYTVNLP